MRAGNNETTKVPDSPIWMNPADDTGPFSHLETPDDVEEIAARVLDESGQQIEERLRPYRTRVTWETLHTLVD